MRTASSLSVLDLWYEEDRDADVDVHVVMTGAGEFVEMEGTGKGVTFTRNELDALLDLANAGVQQLLQKQARPIELTALLFEGCVRCPLQTGPAVRVDQPAANHSRK